MKGSSGGDRFAVWRVGAVLAMVGAVPCSGANSAPVYSISVIAEGLGGPDGLARHPSSGELYVGEENANRVSVIRNGKLVPVLTTFTVKEDVPEWLVTKDRPRSSWLSGQLHSPEGITFAADGSLYVVEDTPRGRVLHFTPNAAGCFTTATVVPVPWTEEAYAWESIIMGRDGRLYLAGSSQEARPGWGSSAVLARGASNDWWVVDYGPFAGFSAVAVSEDEDVLIAGDEATGGVTWWDVGRQKELQTITRSLGAIEGLCLLPDGALAVAQETAPRGTPSGGRILRIDPASGDLTVLADQLGTVETVVCDDKTGKIFVTEDGTGRVLCLTPDTPPGPRDQLLKVARRSGEARRGLPPRQTPGFLKDFLHQVGVQLVDSASDKTGATQQMTLEELGQHIPLVAGQLKVQDMPGVADPITELSFINLFPNQMTVSDRRPTPSLCLFAARHSSGKVDRSQPLSGYHASKRSADGVWNSISRDALLVLPLTTCSAVEDENGVAVSMSFLGLEHFGDCFLTVNYGRKNTATVAVSGEKLVVAPASFTERKPDGAEELHFAMAGVTPRHVDESLWLRIGDSPTWTFNPPEVEMWIPRWTRTHLPNLVDLMRSQRRALLASDPAAPKARPVITPIELRPMISAAPPPARRAEDPGPLRQAEKKTRRETPPLAVINFPQTGLWTDDEATPASQFISRLADAWQQQGFK